MTSTATGRAAEVHEKLDRVRDLLDRRDLDGALFTGQQRVAWVTAGVEDPIIRNFDPGFVWALVTRDGAYIITQNVEGPRIVAEEGPDEIGFEVATFGWHEDRYAELAAELCRWRGAARATTVPVRGRTSPMTSYSSALS